MRDDICVLIKMHIEERVAIVRSAFLRPWGSKMLETDDVMFNAPSSRRGRTFDSRQDMNNDNRCRAPAAKLHKYSKENAPASGHEV